MALLPRCFGRSLLDLVVNLRCAQDNRFIFLPTRPTRICCEICSRVPIRSTLREACPSPR